MTEIAGWDNRGQKFGWCEYQEMEVNGHLSGLSTTACIFGAIPLRRLLVSRRMVRRPGELYPEAFRLAKAGLSQTRHLPRPWLGRNDPPHSFCVAERPSTLFTSLTHTNHNILPLPYNLHESLAYGCSRSTRFLFVRSFLVLGENFIVSNPHNRTHTLFTMQTQQDNQLLLLKVPKSDECHPLIGMHRPLNATLKVLSSTSPITVLH